MSTKLRQLSIIVALLGASSGARAQSAAPRGPKAPPASQPTVARDGKAVVEMRAALETLRKQHALMLSRQKDLEGQLAAVEEASLESSLQKDSQEAFKIYGFFDANFQKWWVPEATRYTDLLDDEASFVFGNLNIYFDFQPLKDWRMLTEIRFLLNPAGDTASYRFDLLGDRYTRVDVRTNDPVNFGEGFEHGAIEIERAWLQWRKFEWLNVSVGLFLTPYGIWNMDHGSPTRVLATAPPPYVFQLFPEKQLGLKLHGAWHFSKYRLEYAMTVSNGRGPASNLRDPDNNKALGGRITLGRAGDWRWTAGISAYWGDASDYELVLLPRTATEADNLERNQTVRYNERAVAADLRLEAGPFGLQWEAMANWREYDDKYRAGWTPRIAENFIPPVQEVIASVFPGYVPDTFGWATIAVLSYRLPFSALNIRPFVAISWMDVDDTVEFDNLLEIAGGINWRLSGAITFKLEYHWETWPNEDPEDLNGRVLWGSKDVHRLSMQTAVAF